MHFLAEKKEMAISEMTITIFNFFILLSARILNLALLCQGWYKHRSDPYEPLLDIRVLPYSTSPLGLRAHDPRTCAKTMF